MPNGLTCRLLASAAALLCSVSIATADTIYVSNEKDNTITVVDGASRVVIRRRRA